MSKSAHVWLSFQLYSELVLNKNTLQTDKGAAWLYTHLNVCITCQQVGMATSTTTLWDGFYVTQSCMKSVQARVKSAGSSLDEPSTPCSNKSNWEMVMAKDWMMNSSSHSYLHPGALYWMSSCCCWIVVSFHNHLINLYTIQCNQPSTIQMKSHGWQRCSKLPDIRQNQFNVDLVSRPSYHLATVTES